MEYKYLKAFALTVKYSSFTKAAKQLRIAQSAVSRQIRLLEESIEEQLIIRSSRKLVLTPRGKELYHLLFRFEALTSSLFSREERREVRLGTLHGVLENWLVNVISTYCQDHDNPVTVTVDTPDALRRGMEEGQYDFILINEDIQNDILSSVKLFDEEWVLISKEEVDLAKIQELPWVVYAKDDFLMTHFKQQSKQIIRINSMTAVLKMVGNGVGVAALPSHMLAKDEKLFRHSLKELDASSVYISMLNYEQMPKHLKSFYTYLTR